MENSFPEFSGLGPKGGNPDGPTIARAQERRSRFNGGKLENGEFTLHAFVDTATHGNKDEQPWHRMAAHLLLRGMSNRQVAEAAGVALSTIGTLRGQRWFQEFLALEAAKTGQSISQVIKGEVLASLETLLEIRDDPEASRREKMLAAQIIIEHGEGKPVQKVLSISTHTNYGSNTEEYQALKEELALLKKQSESFDSVLPQQSCGQDGELPSKSSERSEVMLSESPSSPSTSIPSPNQLSQARDAESCLAGASARTLPQP